MSTIRKELTKKFLQETCHVTSVTADGSIYVNGKLKKTQAVTKQHPFGKPTTYLKINLYYSIIDIGEFGEEVVINKCYSTTVARLMLAWWTGSIKNNEDADHINQNKFDNHIYNLRKISRKENLLNRRER